MLLIKFAVLRHNTGVTRFFFIKGKLFNILLHQNYEMYSNETPLEILPNTSPTMKNRKTIKFSKKIEDSRQTIVFTYYIQKILKKIIVSSIKNDFEEK